ncbi:MAG: c-type cytochrome [Methylococcaceae bacterium]|nr:c-type cytochrome [Methylococcaceae bacterium]
MIRLVIAAIGLLAAGISLAEIETQAIALNCRNCHAADSSEIPTLTNLSAEQINRMLLDYKSDKLPATLMPRIAKGYSDEELKAVADYLGRR